MPEFVIPFDPAGSGGGPGGGGGGSSIGCMTVATMKTEVRMRLGENAADFWQDADIIRALNEAQHRFDAEEKWPWLQTEVTAQTVAANVTTFALTGNVDVTRQFSVMLTPNTQTMPIAGPTRVDPSKGMELRRTLYTPATSPLYYYLVNIDQSAVPHIRWVPVPTVVHSMDYLYFRLPGDLIADSDCADIPVQYTEAIVSWATATLWLKELQGGVKAQEQFNIYNAVLAQAREESLSQADDDILSWGGEEPRGDNLFRDPNWPPRLGP